MAATISLLYCTLSKIFSSSGDNYNYRRSQTADVIVILIKNSQGKILVPTLLPLQQSRYFNATIFQNSVCVYIQLTPTSHTRNSDSRYVGTVTSFISCSVLNFVFLSKMLCRQAAVCVQITIFTFVHYSTYALPQRVSLARKQDGFRCEFRQIYIDHIIMLHMLRGNCFFKLSVLA